MSQRSFPGDRLQARMALRDRLIGEPEGLLRLHAGLRLGSELHQVRCIRAFGEHPELKVDLSDWLRSSRPSVRRATAAALGHRGEGRYPLERALERERTEEGILSLCVALARLGSPQEPLEARLDSFHRRRLPTWSGWKEPAAAARREPPLERFRQAMGELPRTELRAQRLAALEQTTEGKEERQLLLDLASLQHPEDYERLIQRFRSAGRREEHSLHISLGICGDPQGAFLLREVLFATDVDPGRGFAQRRLCAIALGRLGLEISGAWLLKALDIEARDFEGRPGAGLGIQYPVRTDLLEALGELQVPSAIPVLVRHLGDTHGSAFGGFYLAAMDALCRFGQAAVPALTEHVRVAPDLEAANALGVLAMLGVDSRSWLKDPRRMVRETAERVLG